MSKRQQSADVTSHELGKLDKLLEHRSRLGTCVLLADTDAMSFVSLKQLLKETDGNMGAHLRKLEDAGYIRCKKEFDGRVPRTQYALSASGRKALKSYISHMESLIEAMKKI